ncbi:MAG: cupin-like domain-containing protein [Acidobacteriota bacterium]
MAISPQKSDDPVGFDVRRNLSPREFEKEYLEPMIPVILEDCITDWSARDWTVSWFGDNFPDKILHIGDEPIRLGDYVNQLLASDEHHPAPYLRNIDIPSEFPELLPYISRLPHSLPTRIGSRLLPRNLPCEDHYMELFIGGPGSGFPRIHYDIHHLLAFIVQIFGSKEVTLYAPDQADFLYRNELTADHSQIENLLDPDFERYPLWKDAVSTTVVLEPGQALFIPCGWWHYTRMLSPSISVAYDQLCAGNWRDFIGDQYARRRDQSAKAKMVLAYLIMVGPILTVMERLRGQTRTAIDLDLIGQYRASMNYKL